MGYHSILQHVPNNGVRDDVLQCCRRTLLALTCGQQAEFGHLGSAER